MANLKVIRTFHPIGQGGFYSERHNNFNIVYDCGAWPLNKFAKSVSATAFSKDEDIDILFISHFDYDHISKIPTLRSSVRRIRAVVLPLLKTKHKNLLININRTLSHSVLKLIRNPATFFGPNTTIIYVESGEDQDLNNIDSFEGGVEDLRELTESNSKIKLINSGTSLVLRDVPNWAFSPYNHKHKDRHNDLIDMLSKNNKYDIHRLENDPDYTIQHLTDKNTRNELKAIYKKLDGNINENSMLLYSGPVNDSTAKDMWMYESIDNELYCTMSYKEQVGCIYTGDSDFRSFQLKNIYPFYQQYVGVVQVPHHGSIKSFDINALEGFSFLTCPISYGTNNSHKHPEIGVINALSLRQFSPILITENPSSQVIQRIYST